MEANPKDQTPITAKHDCGHQVSLSPTVSFTAPANPLGGQQPLSMSMALQTKSKD